MQKIQNEVLQLSTFYKMLSQNEEAFILNSKDVSKILENVMILASTSSGKGRFPGREMRRVTRRPPART